MELARDFSSRESRLQLLIRNRAKEVNRALFSRV